MSRIPGHIENPSAYAAAIDRNIKANAWKTKRENFKRDHPAMYAVLADCWFPMYDEEEQISLEVITAPERKALLRRLSWLRDGFEEYGSLTQKQLDKAAEIVVEVRERQSKWAEEDRLRLERAEPWPEDAGRTEYPVTVVSYKVKEVPSFNPYDRHMDLKLTMVVERADGSRAWGTCPTKLADAVAELVDVNPYSDEFARHMRGVKLTLRATFEPKHEDPLFAFYKRPHLVSIDVNMEEDK